MGTKMIREEEDKEEGIIKKTGEEDQSGEEPFVRTQSDREEIKPAQRGQ